MSGKLNLSHYSDQELVDIYDKTDKSSTEDSFLKLCEEMAKRGLLFKTFDKGYEFNDKGYYLSESSKVKQEPGYTEKPPEPNYDEDGNYIPNKVPTSTRIFNSIISIAIVSYGSYGLWVNELWIPLNRRVSITLSGFSAALMLIAIVCAAAVMVTEIIDHYDTRENEHTYYKFASLFKYVGFTTFVIAIVSGFLVNMVDSVSPN